MKFTQISTEENRKENAAGRIRRLAVILVMIMVFSMSLIPAHAITGKKVIQRDHISHTTIYEYRKDLGKIDIDHHAVVYIDPEFSGSYYITRSRGYDSSIRINPKSCYSRKDTYGSASTYIQTFGSRREAVVNAQFYHGVKLVKLTNGFQKYYLLIAECNAGVPCSRAMKNYKHRINHAYNFDVEGENGWSVQDVQF